MDKEDKQSIRADEYEEKVQYAPGWPPQPQQEASVDPQLMTDLSEIKEHPPTNRSTCHRLWSNLNNVMILRSV